MLELAVVMNAQGVVEEWTPPAVEFFGFSAEEAVGKSLGDLIVPEALRPYHDMGFKRYVQTRQAHCVGFVVEIEALHKDGRLVPIEMKILPTEASEDLLFQAHIRRLTPES
ncbi:MAG TPA: PAS domain S-box protein [Phycisphaerales bacterium]|nr:PAS domain S-box protein [Phycisphaerales bacterium]